MSAPLSIRRATSAGIDISNDLGLTRWDASHDSSAFQFTRPFAMAALTNAAAFWNRETLGVELTPGVDEVALALMADAWSRTYRSRAVTFSPTDGPVESRNGVMFLPDKVASSWPEETRLPALGDRPPAVVLDNTLEAITARYGAKTMNLVAMQLEYPTHATRRDVRTGARTTPSGTARD